MRIPAALMLLAWLAIGLLLTLSPAHPLPGQVVDDSLVPFHTIRIYLANLDSRFWVGQVIGNLGLLFPVGFLGPIALPWLGRWSRVALLALAYSASIEISQLWIPDRSADVDDVMLNVLGALIGYAIWRIARRRAPASR